MIAAGGFVVAAADIVGKSLTAFVYVQGEAAFAAA